MAISSSSISEALSRLFAWAKEQDFRGHDPHDLLNSPLFTHARSSKNTGEGRRSRADSFMRLIAVQLGRRSPIDVRSLLNVPRTENPKALALFLTGLLRAKGTATPNWETEAEALGARLIASLSAYGGWGYPFPWQSRTHFLPTGTPNIVTTSFAGNALIELYDEFPSAELKEAVQRASNYIVLYVPRVLGVPDGGTANGIAFGYAENDPQIVFNASLLGAEFLLNAGKLLGIQEYVDLAEQAAMFVAAHQHADGAWQYGLEPSQTWIDSFHTGFVIVSMKHIADVLGAAELRTSANRGFEYYRRTFIDPDYAVKYYSDQRYPVDAHAIGQALVTLATFGDTDTAEHVAEWAIANMRSPKGYFYYQRHRLYTNRIAYMRWSNAWMFRGLSEPGLR